MSRSRKPGTKHNKPSSKERSPAATGLGWRARQLLEQGRLQEAFEVACRALAHQAEDPEWHKIAGLAAYQGQDFPTALHHLHRTTLLAPEDLEAQRFLGELYHRTGRSEQALVLYQFIANQGTAEAQDHHRLAVLLQATGQQQTAERHYRRALQDDCCLPETWLGLGNALRSQGKLVDAAQAYQKALQITPEHIAAANNLGAIFLELGDLENARQAYERTVAKAPTHQGAWSNLGMVCQQQGDHHRAMQAMQEARDLDPESARAELAYGRALLADNALDEAELSYQTAWQKLSPEEPFFTNLRGNIFDRLIDIKLRRREPQKALAMCERLLLAHPGDSSLLALCAICHHAVEDNPSRNYLLDFTSLVQAFDISDKERLNPDLITYVLSHPSLEYAPSHHATRQGMHSGDLLSGDTGIMGRLVTHLWQAARDYTIRVQNKDPNHPLLAYRPKNSRLRIWGVIMGEGGHQVAHIHPAAWLSGVYYPKLPNFLREHPQSPPNTSAPSEHNYQPGTDMAGWIEFGRSPDDVYETTPMPTQAFQPIEGRMFLFPGYFYHRTVPYHSPEERISIAFDFVPGEEGAI